MHSAEFKLVQQYEKEKGKTSSSKQPTIKSVLEQATPLQRDSRRWNQLTESVCYFIAKDIQPIDTVNDEGFQAMIKTFEPRYTVPDRKTFAMNYLPKMYATEKKRISNLLQKSPHFSCTTDIWTSRAQHAYLGLTVHYIDDEFSLQNHLLETKEFPDSHTGVNIANEIEKSLKQWKLSKDGLVAFTTDNGGNVVVAIQELDCIRVPCFSHCLNLAVEKACSIAEVTKVIARCRRLVSHFHHSSKDTYVLKQKQADLRHKDHSLIQDVTTRWNSSYYMISRILEQQQPLCAALLEVKRTDLFPSEEEFATMDIYIDVMKPLVTITEAIGAQKWVTISTLRPLLHKLLDVHLIGKPDDKRLAKKMKLEMHTNLSKRYKDDVLTTLSKAAFLDPRLKQLPFLSSTEREDMHKSIKEEAAQMVIPAPVEVEENAPEGPPPVKKAKGEQQLLNLIDDVMHPQSEDQQLTISPEQKSSKEVSTYLLEPETKENPLLWWKMNCFRYPILSRVARKYLCIPATSVPSELLLL